MLLLCFHRLTRIVTRLTTGRNLTRDFVRINEISSTTARSSTNMAGVTEGADIVIRPGVKADCAEIFRMVMALQEHLKLTNTVMTQEALETDGFGERQFFHSLVAENPRYSVGGKDSRALIGHALYFYYYSMGPGRCIWLEDIYVEPDFRQHKIGRRLMQAVAKVGMENNCNGLRWLIHKDENRTAAFYQRLGAADATEKDGWHLYTLSQANMETLAQE